MFRSVWGSAFSRLRPAAAKISANPGARGARPVSLSIWFRLPKRLGVLALSAMLAVGTFTVTTHEAEAKRLGGSRSIGRQAQPMQRQIAPPQAAQPARTAPPAAGAAAKPANRWLGPIAGLAAGLGIAALLSHLGLGGALASMMSNLIIIALLAFVVIWVFRLLARRRAPAEPAYARQAAGGSAFEAPRGAGQPWAAREAAPEPAYSTTPGGAFAAGAAAAAAASAASAVPADFDSEAFLRSAKVHFVRMQAAWDAGNLADIREFTTPEMFGEIQVDLSERGAGTNLTDVVKLDAELLGVEERADEYLASVRFHGLMRESQDAAAAPFEEIWNLSKHAQRGEGWLLAGIQQIN